MALEVDTGEFQENSGTIGVSGTTGLATPLAWTQQVHQNGGSNTGHELLFADQNIDIVGDHLTIQTKDASLITTATLTGSAVQNDVIGLDWTINSVLYQIRYTIQLGDTLSTAATALAGGLNTGTGTGISGTTGFLAALLAFKDSNNIGYKPTAVAAGAVIQFDQPWAAAGNSVVAHSGASCTVTLTNGNILDVGPFIQIDRNAAGRTPVTADQLGQLIFGGNSTGASGIDTQYGSLLSRVLVQDATNPQGELIVGVSDSGSAKNHKAKIYIGNGVSFADSAGNNPGYGGLGVITIGGSLNIASASSPQVTIEPTGSTTGQMAFDCGPSGTQAYLQFKYRGGNLVLLGTVAATQWAAFNNGTGKYLISSNTATGTLSLGEGNQPLTINSSNLITVNNAPIVPSNTVQATPSNPVGTTSTTGVMMGLAVAFTPAAGYGSGKALIMISGDIFNSTAIADGAKVQIRTGTGTAPINGAALTGTAMGGLVQYVAATTAEKVPFSIQVIQTGLALGIPIWIDVSLAAITGGTATVENLSVSVVEV